MHQRMFSSIPHAPPILWLPQIFSNITKCPLERKSPQLRTTVPGLKEPSCWNHASFLGQPGSKYGSHSLKLTWDNSEGLFQPQSPCGLPKVLFYWLLHSPTSPSAQACFPLLPDRCWSQEDFPNILHTNLQVWAWSCNHLRLLWKLPLLKGIVQFVLAVLLSWWQYQHFLAHLCESIQWHSTITLRLPSISSWAWDSLKDKT